MTARHVDDQERRRRLVRRHLLDGDGREERPVMEVVEAIGLLHATDPSTPYLSIAARSDASWADIDQLLYDERALLRHTTIRRTVFVMKNDVAPLAHGAYNAALVAKLRSQLTTWIDAPESVGNGAAVVDRAEAAVLDRLRTLGPASGAALGAEIDELRTMIDPVPGKSYSKPIRITSKVLEVMVADGLIARGRPTGADFTSGAWTWQAIDGWFDDGIPEVEPSEALTRLLTQHLAAFGPATIVDLAWWSGLAKGKVSRALADAATVEVQLDGGATGVLLADDSDREPELDHPSIALLPGLDPTTMGWKERGWYVDDSAAAGVFDRNGNAGPTIWLDGRVVGVWTQRADGEVVTELFESVEQPERDRVGVEALRIAERLGDVRVNWRYPTPITKRLEA